MPSTASTRPRYNQSTQTTIYDANGNALTMTTYFVRETTPTSGNGTTSTWTVYSFVGDQAADQPAAAAAGDA